MNRSEGPHFVSVMREDKCNTWLSKDLPCHVKVFIFHIITRAEGVVKLMNDSEENQTNNSCVIPADSLFNIKEHI